MQILCMRHGHAEPATPPESDADRPLSPRGRQQVRAVAQGLHQAGVRPDRVLSSPLLRARQTAEEAAHVLAATRQVELAPSLAYVASAASAAAHLEALDCTCVLAVGHMPTLPETVYLLSRRQLHSMGTAQVVCVEHGHALWSLSPTDSAPQPL